MITLRSRAISAVALISTLTFTSLGAALPANAVSDISGPVASGFTIDKTSLNIATAPGTITAKIRITDATGTNAPTLVLSHDATGQTQGFGSMTLASGTPTDGIWTKTITVPVGAAPGNWNLTLYRLFRIESVVSV